MICCGADFRAKRSRRGSPLAPLDAFRQETVDGAGDCGVEAAIARHTAPEEVRVAVGGPEGGNAVLAVKCGPWTAHMVSRMHLLRPRSGIRND